MFLKIARVLLLACLPVTVWAMDRTQPIYIESDSLDIDDTRGISSYRGNVIFRQGGSHMWADEIIIYVQDRQALEKIEALGQPAKFKMVPEDETQDETTGEAELLEYRDAEGVMLLKGNAILNQAGNEFSGNIIEYDTVNRIVRAGKMLDAGSNGRVKVTIQPRQQEESKEVE